MNKQSRIKELGSPSSSFVTISTCKFESEKNTKQPSIFFVNLRGEKKIKNCVFTGKIAKETFYIDAQESRSVVVEFCKFSSTMKQTFNTNVISASSNNILEREKLLGSMKLWFAVADFGIAVIALVMKMKGGEKEENENREASLESLESENKF